VLMKQTMDNDDPCVEHTDHNVDSGVRVEDAECHKLGTWSSPLYNTHSLPSVTYTQTNT